MKLRLPLCLIGSLGILCSVASSAEAPVFAPPFLTIEMLYADCSIGTREVKSLYGGDELARCHSFVRGAVESYILDNPEILKPFPSLCTWRDLPTSLVLQVANLPSDTGMDFQQPAAKWLEQQAKALCPAAK